MLSKMRQKHLYWNVLKCTKVWWSKGQSVGCTCSLFGTWADQVLCHYCDLCGHPQGCFDQRMRAWQRWQEAQSTLQKKREAEAKLLWANKPDKLQQAKEDITEVTHIHTHTHAHTRTHTHPLTTQLRGRYWSWVLTARQILRFWYFIFWVLYC